MTDRFESLRDFSERAVRVTIPGVESERFGFLSYDHEQGIRLKFTESIQPDLNVLFKSAFSDNRGVCDISGWMMGGRPFTLFNCFPTAMSRGDIGIASATYFVNSMLNGWHGVSRTRDRVVGEIRAKFTLLDFWMGRSSIAKNQGPSGRHLVGAIVAAEAVLKQSLGCSCVKTGIGIISRHSVRLEDSARPNRASVVNDPMLAITFKDPVTCERAHEELFKLQSLFSIFCGRTAHATQIQLIQHQGVGMQERSSAYFLGRIPYQPDDDIHLREQLFSLEEDVQGCLGDIWQRWQIRSPLLTGPLQLHFSPQLFSGQLGDFQFLSAIQSLEAAHRNLRGGSFMPDQEWLTVCRSLQSSIPKELHVDHQQALKSRIQYGNELSLVRRLRSICDDLPTGVQDALLPRLRKQMRKLVDTRNVLTHSPLNHGKDVYSGDELVPVAIWIRWLFSTWILHEIGFPAKTLESRLRESRQFQHDRARLLSWVGRD